MSKPNINDLLNRLYRVTGFRISIHDKSGREIAAAPEGLHAFCRCLQQNPRARHCCEKSDAEAFRIVEETGALHVYLCPFGLYEAVSPLYRYGTLAGYLMMGQVPESGCGFEEALDRARLYADPATLREALEVLPGYTREKIEAFAEVMAVFAEYLTLIGAVQPQTEDLPAALHEYLMLHYAEPITIPSLCAHFAFSRTALLKHYRERFGESIGQALIRIRMTQARKMLTETDLPITQIAARCGYAEPGYFAKAYRKYYGHSPTDARPYIKRSGE